MLHFVDRISLVVFFLFLQVAVPVRIAGSRLTWVPRSVCPKDACEDDYIAGLDVVGAWADSAATSEGILRNTAGDIFLV